MLCGLRVSVVSFENSLHGQQEKKFTTEAQGAQRSDNEIENFDKTIHRPSHHHTNHLTITKKFYYYIVRTYHIQSANAFILSLQNVTFTKSLLR